MQHAFDLTREMLAVDPNHERARNNLQYYSEVLRDEKVRIENEKGLKNVRNAPKSKEDYEALCRGDVPEVSFFNK